MSTMVEFRNVVKSFGAVQVLEGLSFKIEEGAFTSLLGASGSGKTTALNLLAGLDQPTSGDVLINDGEVFSSQRGLDVPIERRNIGFVFQSYALWPHMRVVDIVAYPLRIRGIGKVERHKAANAILERLELGHLGQRYPFELSGGQQQRVAIARSLVYRPRLLLLDEPLSNLDAQLRERAREWLAKVHAEFQLTTVLVTHDYVEALTLSNHVILLRNGKIEQNGTAQEIYEAPLTAYAADFVGGANTFSAAVEASDRAPGAGFNTRIRLGGAFSLNVFSRTGHAVGADVKLAVRPQKMHLVESADSPHGAEDIVVPLMVKSALYRGNDWEVAGTSPVGEMRVVSPHAPRQGSNFVLINNKDCHCVAG
ncbi:ABC transporter ATP-binding protein [Shinella sp.]|uniref:ABC transporter ATP-binding protein n=1 Tax=Shinella sp. TaxID=1870904 RepID=UPI003F6F43D9